MANEVLCAVCGTATEAGRKFCGECGTALTADGASPSAGLGTPLQSAGSFPCSPA